MNGFRQRWEGNPKWMKIALYAMLGTAGFALLVLFFGWLIQLLWNWLMPAIFGLGEINFWQGIGLFALARFLFGGFGGQDRNPKAPRKRKDGCGNDEGEKNGRSWKHYDEWWEREGKRAFQEYAGRAEPKSGERGDDADSEAGD